MFCAIHSFLQKMKNSLKKENGAKPFSTSKGQVAVILILIVAILLVILAIVINLAKSSQNKAITNLAADFTASQLVSSMASFAEMQYMTAINTEGSTEVEGLTRREPDWGGLGYVVSAIVVIIGLVIIILSWATLAAPVLSLVTVIVTAVLLVASVIIDLCYLKPMLDSMWGKMMDGFSETADKVVEQGVNSGLQRVVSDSVEVPDTGDFDADGYYFGDGTPIGDREKVNRFAYLYTKRLEYLLEAGNYKIEIIKNFQRALGEFTWKGGNTFWWDVNNPLTDDGWGVYDPFWHDPNNPTGGCPAQGTFFHNECNPGCGPGGSVSSCPSNGTDWRFIFDQNFETSGNQFKSFRETLGRDDENPQISFDSNGYAYTVTPPSFLEKDSTGLYQLLWKVEKTDLSQQNCFWYGQDNPAFYSACPSSQAGFQLPFGNETCAHPNYFLDVNECWSVPDRLDGLSSTLPLLAENACYQTEASFSWKKGVNVQSSHRIYSSGDDYLPYDYGPGKYCGETCTFQGQPACCPANTGYPSCIPGSSACVPERSCGIEIGGNPVNNQAFWRVDLVDKLRYDEEIGIQGYLDVLKDYSLLSAPPSELVTTLTTWFPKIEPWIKQGGSQDPGQLERWKNILTLTKAEIQTFLSGTYPGDMNTICGAGTIPGGGQPTLQGIMTCYNGLLAAINSCLNNCSSASGNMCSQVANVLDLVFQEPPCVDPATCPSLPANYVGQDTGCTVSNPAKPYVFSYELQNWAAKITHRKTFLSDLVTQGIETIADLQQAIDKIDGFLNDPRVQALLDLINTPVNILDQGSVAIYAWQDEPKEGEQRGRWHVVRIDSKIPTRCGGTCKRHNCGDNCPEEPNMPTIVDWKHWVHTNAWWTLTDYDQKGKCGTNNDSGPWWCWTPDKYQKHKCWNMESYRDENKCFKGGMVKARAIRFDEDSSLFVRFANNISFWRFLYENPSGVVSGGTAGCMEVEDIEKTGCCGAIMAAGEVAGASGLPGAVMLNELTTHNNNCWLLLHRLLRQGTETRSCAEYFYRHKNDTGEATSVFGVKFVPCPASF